MAAASPPPVRCEKNVYEEADNDDYKVFPPPPPGTVIESTGTPSSPSWTRVHGHAAMVRACSPSLLCSQSILTIGASSKPSHAPLHIMFTELPAGHVMPAAGHSGDDELYKSANAESSLPSEADLYAAMLVPFLSVSLYGRDREEKGRGGDELPVVIGGDGGRHEAGDDDLRDESYLPSESDLYAAMLAPFLGVSFHANDEGEQGRGGGGRHEAGEEEEDFKMLPPPSPEAILRGYKYGDYWSSPRCSCTLRACRWRHRDRGAGDDKDGYVSAKEELAAAPAPGNTNGSAEDGVGGSVADVFLRQVVEASGGELIGEEEDTSYDADTECECGGARCTTCKDTRVAAARRRRNSEVPSVAARITAMAAGALLAVRRLVV